MEITEHERHQLFTWFEEHMGPERAAAMMNALPPVAWSEVVAKRDLAEMELRLDARLSRLESTLTRSFVTWLLTSQAVTIAVVGLVVSLR